MQPQNAIAPFQPGVSFLAVVCGPVKLFSCNMTDCPINVSSSALLQIHGLSTTNLKKES